MAQPNRNRAPESRRDDMPARTNQPPSLDYPQIAIDYGIDKALWLSLLNLYPGAQPESIVMVYEYCKARTLDPLKKPVHIVPMYIEDKTTGRKGMRDVIMPGIQEMRTTAARTREYAGIDPVKLAPSVAVPVTNAADATANVKTIEAPEWAEVTVYRLVQGKRYGFTHREYFIEAVARKSGGLINEMWQKRSIGQLSKCAEAGALRKAFPEELGGEYAAEEMEGREEFVVPELIADANPSGIAEPETLPAKVEAPAAEPVAEAAKPADDATRAITPEERAELAKAKAEAAHAAKKEAAKPEPKAEPAKAEPQQEAAAGDFKIDLPAGAMGVLKSNMEQRGVSEAQLLAKLGKDVTVRTINEALAVLKAWG